MSLAEKYLPYYTYEDYKQWEGNWELINGIPYAMAPSPLKKHQLVAVRIVSPTFSNLNFPFPRRTQGVFLPSEI
jgi:hypothetical protein